MGNTIFSSNDCAKKHEAIDLIDNCRVIDILNRDLDMLIGDSENHQYMGISTLKMCHVTQQEML